MEYKTYKNISVNNKHNKHVSQLQYQLCKIYYFLVQLYKCGFACMLSMQTQYTFYLCH